MPRSRSVAHCGRLASDKIWSDDAVTTCIFTPPPAVADAAVCRRLKKAPQQAVPSVDFVRERIGDRVIFFLSRERKGEGTESENVNVTQITTCVCARAL